VVEGWYYQKDDWHMMINGDRLNTLIDPATLELCSEPVLKVKPKEIMDYWNKLTDEQRAAGNKIKSRVIQMSDTMKTHLKARCKEPYFTDNWQAIIDHARRDVYWSGRKDTYKGLTLKRLLDNNTVYTSVLQAIEDAPIVAEAKGVEQRETSLDRLARVAKERE